MLARVALALVALTVLVLCGAWLRASLRFEEGRRLAQQPGALGRDDARRADRLLSGARRFDADAPAELYRAALRVRLGKRRQGIEWFERVARSEPANVRAWSLLALAAVSIDPELSRRANARLRALNPRG